MGKRSSGTRTMSYLLGVEKELAQPNRERPGDSRLSEDSRLSGCAGGGKWKRKLGEGKGLDRERCSRQFVRTAEPSARSPSSQPLEDLFTAGRAGRNTGREGSELVAGSNNPREQRDAAGFGLLGTRSFAGGYRRKKSNKPDIS